MPDGGISTAESARRIKLMETVARIKRKSFLKNRLPDTNKNQKYQYLPDGEETDDKPLPAPPAVQPEQQPAAAAQLQERQQQGRVAEMQKQILANGMVEKKKKEIQAEMRKQAKQAIRQGLESLFEGVSDAFGASLIGIIITILVNLIVLADWDLQMFSYYQKNQALRFFFPPLTWPPPFSNYLPNVALHVGLVTLNLIVAFFTLSVICIVLIIAFLPLIILVLGAEAVYFYATDPGFQQMVNELVF